MSVNGVDLRQPHLGDAVLAFKALNGGEAERMLTRKFMTVREVADLAQVSEATVRHWIKDGGLRAIDVGREFRIIPRDLEAFFDLHATSGVRPGDSTDDAPGPRDRGRDA